MLTEKTIGEICKILGLKQADFATAIKDEKEVDVEIPQGLTVLSESELKKVKDNEYQKGRVDGVEIEVKDFKQKLGLDFTGKTIENLLNAHKNSVLSEAKIEPEKKVVELQEKVTTLQNTVKEYEGKLSAKEKEVEGVYISNNLLSVMPENTILPKEKIIALMKSDGYDFQKKDGKIVAVKDGKVVEDKLSNPMELKDITTKYATDNSLLKVEKAPKGRGGDDEKGNNSFSKLSEIKAKFKEEGKSEYGDEFRNAVQEAVKANPDFEMSA